MKKAITLVIGLALLANGAQAQNEVSRTNIGTAAGQFLKVGVGARAIGLGGSFAALANDITALYWNPAGIATIRGRGEAVFNHAEWLAETTFDFAGAALNIEGFGSVGVSVTAMSVPEDIVRTYDFPDGTGQRFDASALALGVSYARNLTDRFAIGFTGRFVREQIWNETANAMAIDIGTLYVTPFRDLRIGATIANFGTKLRLEGRDILFNNDPFDDVDGPVDQVPSQYRTDEYNLPLTLRLGLAYDVYRNENVLATIVTDAVHPNDNAEYVNTGVEISVRNLLYLRGGYRALFLDDSEQSYTFGAGLRYDAVGTHLRLDFGYADFGRLDNVQFISFAVGF